MPVKEMAFPFLLPGICKRQPRYLVTGEISVAQSFPFIPRTFIADKQSKCFGTLETSAFSKTAYQMFGRYCETVSQTP